MISRKKKAESMTKSVMIRDSLERPILGNEEKQKVTRGEQYDRAYNFGQGMVSEWRGTIPSGSLSEPGKRRQSERDDGESVHGLEWRDKPAIFKLRPRPHTPQAVTNSSSMRHVCLTSEMALRG